MLRAGRHYLVAVAVLSDEGAEERVAKSAPLHDIGKVGIPDAILLKPGRLSETEFEEMKRHTEYGGEALTRAEEILGTNSFLTTSKTIALTHHEKWDGFGCPRGLAGEAVPVAGRLMALADVYDALITKRVYKEAFSFEKAKRIIRQGGPGSHFDPAVVDAFDALGEDFKAVAARFTDEAYA